MAGAQFRTVAGTDGTTKGYGVIQRVVYAVSDMV